MNIKSYNMHNIVPEKKFNNNRFLDKYALLKPEQNTNLNINTSTNRPAQAISFGGSVDLVFKDLSHRLINFVYENEAAYKAVYAMIVAGMIKPFFVLNMPGSEEKDKQIVATKNSLQAFIGFAIEMTVAGKLAKNAIDVVKNNLKLIKENTDGKSFFVPKQKTEVLTKMATESLKKDKSGLMTKFRYIKEDNEGISTAKALWQAFRKKAVVATSNPGCDVDKEIFINISPKEIEDRCEQILKTAEEHLDIYNRPGAFDYIKRLKTAIEKTLDHQRLALIDSINSGATESDVKAQYKQLVDTIVDNVPHDLHKKYRAEIKAKAKELEPSLNKENAKEALDTLFEFIKDKKIQESLMDTYTTVWKNSTGLITVISKAKIASLLLPTVMAVIFAKRNAQKQKEKESRRDGVLENSAAFNKEKHNFYSIFKDNKKPSPVSFTGSMDKFINNLAKGVEKISFSDFGQKMVEKMRKLPVPLNKTASRMGDLESFIITGYWLQNTARSKKIDPEQKLGLNMHTLLVTLASSTFAFLIDTALDSRLNKLKDKYVEGLTEAARNAIKSENIEKTLKEGCEHLLDGEKAAKQIKNVLVNATGDFFDKNGKLIENTELFNTIDGFAKDFIKKTMKFKSHTVFTTVVRFLTPVLMVPITGKAKQYIKKRRKEREEAKNITAKNNIAK